MKIYLQTADNLMEREHQDLLDLYERFNIPRNSDVFQDIGHVVKFSEFRELARLKIPVLTTWCKSHKFEQYSDDTMLRFRYGHTRHSLRMLCEAVNPRFHANMQLWRAYRDM